MENSTKGNPTKVIKLNLTDSKEELYNALKYAADSVGSKLNLFCLDIIKDALKNKNDYNKPLNKLMAAKGGKSIVIQVTIEVKKEFQSWAKEKGRTQGKHTAFIFEKWCEMNNVSAPKDN